MSRIFKIFLAFDQLFGAFLFGGIFPDESISAYCYRKSYWKRVALIDFVMREKGHCFNAYFSEKHGTQNAHTSASGRFFFVQRKVCPLD